MKTLIDNICEALVKGNVNKMPHESKRPLVGKVGSNGIIRNIKKWPSDVVNMIEYITFGKNNNKITGEDLENRLWYQEPYKDEIDKYYNMICAVCDPEEVMDVYSLARSGKQHKIEVIVQVVDFHSYNIP